MSSLMNWEWATHVGGLAVIPWLTAGLFAGLLATAVFLWWTSPPDGGEPSNR